MILSMNPVSRSNTIGIPPRVALIKIVKTAIPEKTKVR